MLKDAEMEGSLGLTLWGSAAENVNVVLNDTVVVTTPLSSRQCWFETKPCVRHSKPALRNVVVVVLLF